MLARTIIEGEATLSGLPFSDLTDDVKADIETAIYDALYTEDNQPNLFVKFSPSEGRSLRESQRRLAVGDTVAKWKATFSSEEFRAKAAVVLGDGSEFTTAVQTVLNDSETLTSAGVVVNDSLSLRTVWTASR